MVIIINKAWVAKFNPIFTQETHALCSFSKPGLRIHADKAPHLGRAGEAPGSLELMGRQCPHSAQPRPALPALAAVACCRAGLPGCCPWPGHLGTSCPHLWLRGPTQPACTGSAHGRTAPCCCCCSCSRCSHLPGSTPGGELQITREGSIFAPRLFTGYFKGAAVPREILRRVCSAAGHIDPLPVLTLSSCPWLASGGHLPDLVLACRTLGAPGFGVSTVLTKLQLGFLSRL